MRTDSRLELMTWPALDARGVDAVVTGRAGGVSAGPYESLNLSLSVGDEPANVLENRRRLAVAFGAGPADFVFARQVHGAGVRIVGEADRGRGTLTQDDAIPDTDALVTNTPGMPLAILAADCVPVVLHDPVANVLGCVHSGWRGTAARVGAETVAVMAKLGARPEDIVAGLGPAIDPGRYQVGPEVREAFAADAAFFRPDPSAPGRWLLDLWTANRELLREAGLRAENIHVTGVPTGRDFFSDRARRPCGRFALIARLREARATATATEPAR